MEVTAWTPSGGLGHVEREQHACLPPSARHPTPGLLRVRRHGREVAVQLLHRRRVLNRCRRPHVLPAGVSLAVIFRRCPCRTRGRCAGGGVR